MEYDKYDAEMAAEQHAEYEWDNSAGECGENQTVHVRDEAGSLHVFRVRAEFEVSFYASEIEQAPGEKAEG